MPISVATLSYAGSLAVTVTADASVRDLHVAADGMARAFHRCADLATESHAPKHLAAVTRVEGDAAGYADVLALRT